MRPRRSPCRRRSPAAPTTKAQSPTQKILRLSSSPPLHGAYGLMVQNVLPKRHKVSSPLNIVKQNVASRSSLWDYLFLNPCTERTRNWCSKGEVDARFWK